MEICCVFPPETLLHILRYTGPRDVIRWRAVSKWFRDITYDTSLWRDLYANSCLPRPPGLCPLQACLEQALVRTEKLAHFWTTRPMRVVSHVELRTAQGAFKLLEGRWFVRCDRRRGFVLYDIAPFSRIAAPQEQVIWEQENSLGHWDLTSITTKDGQPVLYVLFSERDGWMDGTVCRLLELRLNGESGKPCGVAIFEVPGSLRFDVKLEGGKSPFLYIWYRNLVFDTRTHIFYEVPEFCTTLDETLRKMNPDFEFSSPPASIVLTRTHVIVIHKCSRFMALIQAFTADESSVKNGKHFLRLSHEGVSNHLLPTKGVTLLRNSIVDPVTGSTNVRLLNKEADRVSIVLNDLTLPNTIGNDVSPIIIVTDKSITRTLYEHGVKGPHYKVDCSDAGYLMGFYIKYHNSRPSLPGHFDPFSIKRFVVDATQDKCKLAFGELLPPEPNHMGSPFHRWAMTFDGARGRLCFVKSFEDEKQVVVLADIE